MIEVPLPPHQASGHADWVVEGDGAGYFPSATTAAAYAKGIVESAYHADRLRTLTHVVAVAMENGLGTELTVLDYGIGDGGELRRLDLPAAKVIGIDVSPSMIELARSVLAEQDLECHVGGVDVLVDLASESVDLALCVNTLGYLTDADQAAFFGEMSRIVRPGGFLLVMTGNELFDLFALNSGTATFFSERLGVPGSSRLLREADAPRFVNASRRNPLSFGAYLATFGFDEIAQGFCAWHTVPPALVSINEGLDVGTAREKARDYSIDANALPAQEAWRALLQCSIFATMARRADRLPASVPAPR